jgi:hypothetical protein
MYQKYDWLSTLDTNQAIISPDIGNLSRFCYKPFRNTRVHPNDNLNFIKFPMLWLWAVPVSNTNLSLNTPSNTLDGWVRFMMFNATFNNMSVISWRSVLLVEETGVPGEIHRPAASDWQTLTDNALSGTPHLDSNSQR